MYFHLQFVWRSERLLRFLTYRLRHANSLHHRNLIRLVKLVRFYHQIRHRPVHLCHYENSKKKGFIKVSLLFAIAKTMAQEEFCQGCNQRHRCQEVYQRLGSTEGPSVAFKVVVAFLLEAPYPLLWLVLSVNQIVLASERPIPELQDRYNRCGSVSHWVRLFFLVPGR